MSVECPSCGKKQSEINFIREKLYKIYGSYDISVGKNKQGRYVAKRRTSISMSPNPEELLAEQILRTFPNAQIYKQSKRETKTKAVNGYRLYTDVVVEFELKPGIKEKITVDDSSYYGPYGYGVKPDWMS